MCVLSSSSQCPAASACTPCEISETPDTLRVEVCPNTATGFFAPQYPAYSKAYDGTRVVYASLRVHAPCGAVVTASLLLPQPPTPTLLGPPLASIVQKGGGKRPSAFPPIPRADSRGLARAFSLVRSSLKLTTYHRRPAISARLLARCPDPAQIRWSKARKNARCAIDSTTARTPDLPRST